jgi:hypothetical protein
MLLSARQSDAAIRQPPDRDYNTTQANSQKRAYGVAGMLICMKLPKVLSARSLFAATKS